MNTQLTKLNDQSGIISISLVKTDYEEQVERYLKGVRQKINIPGFRVGMAPMGMVKKMYGKSALAEKLNEICSNALMRFIETEQIDIICSPLPSLTKELEGNFDAPDTFVFSYDIAFTPKFNLVLDKNLSFQFKKIKITEEQLNDEVDRIAKRNGDLVEREEFGGEDVVFSFRYEEIELDGTPVEDGTKGESFFGFNAISDELLKEEIRLAAKQKSIDFSPKQLSNDEKELSRLFSVAPEQVSTLPEKFRMHIHKIQSLQASELNDEFFLKNYPEGDVTNLEQMRNKIREQIESYYESSSNQMFLYSVQKKLIDETMVVLDVDFIRRWLMATDERMTEEKLQNEFDKYLNGIKWNLIDNKLNKDYNISFEEEELVEFVKKSVKDRFLQYGLANVDEETLNTVVKREMNDKKARNQHEVSIRDAKLLELIKKQCTVDILSLAEEEFFSFA